MDANHDQNPFPNSWFRIGCTQELAPRQVIPLHYFGKELVLFRAEDGTAHVLDAHCPHLGAHLGYNGTIIKDTIRCPYHGWRWQGNGHCAEVPYINKTPQTKLRSYPVREVNGLIMLYYHQEGQMPTWEIPAIAEYTCKQWTPLQPIRTWKARTTLQNYLDNSVDVAHLSQLHQQTFRSAKTEQIEINGPIFSHTMSQHYNLSSLSVGGLIPEKGRVTTTYYGPGYDVSFYWTQGKIKLGLLQIFTGTPIDHNCLEIQIFLSVKKSLPGPLNTVLAALLKKDTLAAFEQDIPILEHKIYCNNPILYKEDGPIMQCRQWASQFYQ
ncbi:MAG: Rieske 2Fe-2S domain-containing protein [Chloroflexaceae bacterium]|nr:Rieske 2Fe-2S domain-containing protein [Chloroflexaceae bacterium]